MTLSTKSVEANVIRVYRKLGVANRSQLATLPGGGERVWRP